MKSILPKESSLKGILNQSTPFPHAILYVNIKCNTSLQKKGNLNLHAQTSMQTKNKNGNYETTPAPMLR